LNNKCKLFCDNNCNECESATVCKVCNLNYQLSNSKLCIPDKCYDSNCNICTSGNPKSCFECKTNYYRYNGECYDSCKKDCIKCDIYNRNNCLICNPGYHIESGKCILDIECPDTNCQYCNSSDLKCYLCKEFYNLSDGSCLLDCLDKNCYQCKDHLSGSCEICNSDYYASDGKCVGLTWVKIVVPIFTISLVFVIFLINKYFCKKNDEEGDIENSQQENNDRSRNNDHVYELNERNNNNVTLPNEENNVENNNPPIEFDDPSLRSGLKISSKSIGIVPKDDKDALKDEKKKHKCIICKKKNGKYIANCGCYLCSKHKKKVLGDKKENKCPKCGVEITTAEKESKSCQICFEVKEVIVNFHDDCVLKVCQECKEKCMKGSDKCPNCRIDIKKEKN